MKTQIIGKRFHHFRALASTNDCALSILGQGLPLEGTVIVADCQYAGRGQRGAVWEGEDGKNLYFTVILYPDFLGIENAFALSQAVALGAMELIKRLVEIPVSIKWPNDIMAGLSKIGGILIQNGFQGSSWKYSVVGIGLNINQTGMADVVSGAISASDLTGVMFDLRRVRNELCECLEKQYNRLKGGEFQEIRSDYSNNLFLRNEESVFQLENGQIVSGTPIGVSNTGKLELLIDGHLREFAVKQIQLVREV